MMTQLLSYIVWNPDLEAFHLGPMTVRWYGLMWIIGLALAYLVVKRLYKEQKIKDELFDPLFIYCFFGILIGARLGHCIFYQPQDFLTSWQGFVEMLLPIHFLPEGGWKLTGYAGLASHGGTLGLMIALWLYVRKTKLSIWTVLDNIAIATGTTACFIRLGNLMNSEQMCPGLLSSRKSMLYLVIQDNSTRPSPMRFSSLSCGSSINVCLRRSAQAGTSASV